MAGYQTISEALVMPLRGTLDRFSGGVFADGQCLEASLLYRDQPPRLYGEPAPAEIVARALKPGGAARLAGVCLFGGYLFRHYGHFLIETLARLYVLKLFPDLPVLFSSTHRDVLPWQLDVFKLVGLRNRIIKLTEPVVAERLILTEPGCSLPDRLRLEQAAALGAMPAPPLTARKIWLARTSHLGGGVINEKDLHPELEARGWEIVHPQYLPIRKQVALISSSARVAGFDGSAFHTALLAREIRGRFDIFFVRNVGSQAYSRIAAIKGIDQRETLLCPERGTVRYLLGQGAERFFELVDQEAVFGPLEDGSRA